MIPRWHLYLLLDTWQEHADLMRIEGVTPEIANALNLIGIDSVKEFANRNVKNTVVKLKGIQFGYLFCF